MIAQYYPTFPFSVLDFGLTALALILMGVMGYFFTRLVQTQHKNSKEIHEKNIAALERLMDLARLAIDSLHELSSDMAELRDDVHRNRRLIDEIARRIEEEAIRQHGGERGVR